MKLTSRIFVLVAISAVLLTYSGCHKTKPPAPSDQEVQLGKLKNTWKANSVTKDGTNLTTDYSNFTLTISGTAGASSFGYATAGRPAAPKLSPWQSSGSWVFDTDPLSGIIRDKGTVDELPMTYTVSETTLTLNFTFSGTGYPNAGRVENVTGVWVVVFTKQ